MRACRTDERHAEVAKALRACGYAYLSLHRQGGGCEDFLVAARVRRLDYADPRHSDELRETTVKVWVMLEVKTQRGKGKPRFTEAQLDWYSATEGYPRIVATSGQDAIKQLRALEA